MKKQVVHTGGTFIASHKLLPQPNFVMDNDLLVQPKLSEEEAKVIDSSPIDIEKYTEEDDELFAKNLKNAK